MKVIAIFGPTAVGKTAVAIETAERLRSRGEDPVAVSCDALQVYRGIETITGAPDEQERARLEHRLVGIAELDEEFSAGRFAEVAHREIDSLLSEGRRPIVVGGAGLYLRAALADLDLRPRVASEVRAEVEEEMAARGSVALHAALEPELRELVHPNDRKRIARLTELQRAGVEPPRSSEGLWGEGPRHPTLLVGLAVDREELARRIHARVERMVASGAGEEARRAIVAGASRTARAAIGLEELSRDDAEAARRAQGAYARRQLTWMRKLRGIEVIDRTGLDDGEVAARVVAALDAAA